MRPVAFYFAKGLLNTRTKPSKSQAHRRRFAKSVRSFGQRHSGVLALSRLVIKLLRCEIAGAARITIGIMRIHASAHDLTQCPKNPAAQGKLRAATAAAIALVRADWMAAKRKCA
jgi:hypothetical protein